MKRMIVSTKTIECNGYSIYDTGFGYKLYKDGQLASDVEYDSFDDAMMAIDNMKSGQPASKEYVEEKKQTRRNWLKEFSNYTKNMPTRVYPDDSHDGVYAEGNKTLERYLKSFKQKNPECDLQIFRTVKNGAFLYVVR